MSGRVGVGPDSVKWLGNHRITADDGGKAAPVEDRGDAFLAHRSKNYSFYSAGEEEAVQPTVIWKLFQAVDVQAEAKDPGSL